MKRNRIAILFAAAVLCTGMIASASEMETEVEMETEAETEMELESIEETELETGITGTYSMKVDAFEPACYSTDVLLTLNEEVDDADASDFAVTEAKDVFDYATNQLAESVVEREVIDAYTVDEDGERVNGPSKYVHLELKPTSECLSIFGSAGAYGLNVWDTTYHINISLAENADLTDQAGIVEEFTIDPVFTSVDVSDSVKKFDCTQTFESSSGVTYRYASYTPIEDSDRLIVWLHGLGEGGTESTDPSIILLAAQSNVLGSEKFQDAISGAHILMPQCPTWWMDPDGTGQVLDGSTPNSFYAESLDEFIDSYAEQVGAKKIVIAGCSNGGYMTMVMALRNPDKYAAIIPICEALEYSEDLNEGLDALKHLPMFFIFSTDDPLVVPQTYEIPTLEYLFQTGADELHVSATEHVYGTVGDEEPTMQFGHASWIYFFNNKNADEEGLNAWDWLSEVLY